MNKLATFFITTMLIGSSAMAAGKAIPATGYSCKLFKNDNFVEIYASATLDGSKLFEGVESLSSDGRYSLYLLVGNELMVTVRDNTRYAPIPAGSPADIIDLTVDIQPLDKTRPDLFQQNPARVRATYNEASLTLICERNDLSNNNK